MNFRLRKYYMFISRRSNEYERSKKAQDRMAFLSQDWLPFCKGVGGHRHAGVMCFHKNCLTKSQKVVNKLLNPIKI